MSSTFVLTYLPMQDIPLFEQYGFHVVGMDLPHRTVIMRRDGADTSAPVTSRKLTEAEA